jgi:hypothetical protein
MISGLPTFQPHSLGTVAFLLLSELKLQCSLPFYSERRRGQAVHYFG